MLMTKKETRRFTRIAAQGPVHFLDGSGAPGHGLLQDVSYGGLRLELGRYIRPQTAVEFPVSVGSRKIALPAQVVWCKPSDTEGTFRAGLRADHGGQHTMAILSSWVLDAVRPATAPCVAAATKPDAATP